MMLAAFEKIHLEVAAVFSMCVFALAFVMQLLPSRSEDMLPYSELFRGMLVTNASPRSQPSSFWPAAFSRR